MEVMAWGIAVARFSAACGALAGLDQTQKELAELQ